MKLKVTVDPAVFMRAQLRAAAENTSVDEVVREYLAAYADGHISFRAAAADGMGRGRDEAMRSLIRLSEAPRPVTTSARITSGMERDRNWTRDEIYDR